MKHLIIAVALIGSLTSCNGVGGWFGSSEDSSAYEAKAGTAMARDVSITEANSYSDLFMDSADVDRYIQEKKIRADLAQNLRNFYNVRNYQFAWFNKDGVTEQGIGFWNLYKQEAKDGSGKDSSTIDKGIRNRMDSLLEDDSLIMANTDSSFKQAELALTHQFIAYTQSVDSNQMAHDWLYWVPARRLNPVQAADSLLARQKDTTQAGGKTMYAALRSQLAVYHKAATSGGWQPITGVTGVRKGASSPAVTALKKRLQQTGDYPASDTTAIYNDSLVSAIKDVQTRFGLAPTGTVNDSLVTALNVPAEKRLSQIMINMNRTLWAPKTTTDSNQLVVNIPSFMLYAYEGSSKAFEMPVVVGKEGANTLMFTGNINQVVFSPYWNLPESIVRDEIMPAMKRDASYLKKNNMEIVSNKDSIPQIRQLPGAGNALGKVKFLFPNSYDIYLHDTPAKELFNRQNRALSHGCIRVADAAKLAQYLLRDQPEWTPEKIMAAMNSGKEQKVSVKNDVPVSINYYTAWVNEKGQMHFAADVYKHDEKTAARLFGTPVAGNASPATTTDSTKKSI